MDIYMLIHADHESAKRRVAQINALEDDRHAARLDLFRALKKELLAHNDSEEATFYVALEEHTGTRDDALLAFREHHEADRLLELLDDAGLPPVEWRARFGEFQKALLAHINHEENTIFSQARAVLSQELSHQLAEIMQGLKERNVEAPAGPAMEQAAMALTKETLAREVFEPKLGIPA